MKLITTPLKYLFLALVLTVGLWLYAIMLILWLIYMPLEYIYNCFHREIKSIKKGL